MNTVRCLVDNKADINIKDDKQGVSAGPEPAILDWYGHCGVKKLGGLGACSPRKILKLGTLRSLLRPCLGQNATRIIPPVVL